VDGDAAKEGQEEVLLAQQKGENLNEKS